MEYFYISFDLLMARYFIRFTLVKKRECGVGTKNEVVRWFFESSVNFFDVFVLVIAETCISDSQKRCCDSLKRNFCGAFASSVETQEHLMRSF